MADYTITAVAVLGVVLLTLWRLLRADRSGTVPRPGPTDTAAARPVPEAYKDYIMRWEPYARRYGQKFGIPWQIIAAQIWTESTGDPTETGSAGEVGLMQLKKRQAVADVKQFTEVDVSGWDQDPIKNIEVGAAYLSINLRSGRADGDLYLALRMYNQGPGGAYTNAAKSRRYADKVLKRAKQLGFNG